MCFQELARPQDVTARTGVRTMTSLRLNPDLNFPVEDTLSSLPAINTLRSEINCFEFADPISNVLGPKWIASNLQTTFSNALSLK